MSIEQKRAWIGAVVAISAYAFYVVAILRRSSDISLAEVPYISMLLWSVAGGTVVTIVLNIVVMIASPRDAGKKDQRDREIHRISEYIGQSFVITGAVAALIMAMIELDHFWIANVIYLAFVLSTVVGATAKLVAYSRGFQGW